MWVLIIEQSDLQKYFYASNCLYSIDIDCDPQEMPALVCESCGVGHFHICIITHPSCKIQRDYEQTVKQNVM